MVNVTGTPGVGVDELAAVLDVDLGDGPEDPTRDRVTRAFNTAKALVDHQLADQFRPIEADVLDTLYLEVGSEVYKRADAPGGGSQYVDLQGGQSVRGPRDPLNRSYPTLAQYRVSL